MERWVLWPIVAVSYLLIFIGSIRDGGLETARGPILTACWILFIIQSFAFQLGLFFYPILLWAVWRRRKRLAAAAGLLVAVHLSWWVPSCLPGKNPPIVGGSLKVMSVNLQENNNDIEPVLEDIRREDPDLLFFQEYTPAWNRILRKALAGTHPNRAMQKNGMAIYSKLVLHEPQSHIRMGGWHNPQIRVALPIDGRLVALYNLHFLRPSGGRQLAEDWRMFSDMMGLLADEKLPVIVAGDFNFTNMSVYHKRLTESGFIDPHGQAGIGLAYTWPSRGLFNYLPGLRVDRIYLRGGLTARDCRVCPRNSSDHRPIVAEVGFAS